MRKAEQVQRKLTTVIYNNRFQMILRSLHSRSKLIWAIITNRCTAEYNPVQIIKVPLIKTKLQNRPCPFMWMPKHIFLTVIHVRINAMFNRRIFGTLIRSDQATDLPVTLKYGKIGKRMTLLFKLETNTLHYVLHKLFKFFTSNGLEYHIYLSPSLQLRNFK